VAVFSTGLLLSLLGSWRPSLWSDEAATISAAQRSLAELWDMVHNIDAVHAVYYLLMHGWLQVFPAEAFFLRLPSALATGLTAVGVYWLGCRLASPQAAVCGALVLAVLPRTTWMGLEARSYAFSALLAVAATLVLVVVTMTSTPRRELLGLAGYAALVAVGIAMSLYLALLLVAHGISLLLQSSVSWRLRWRWLGASVTGLVLAGPVVWAATHQTGQLGSAFSLLSWVRSVVVSQWFLGQTPTLTTDDGGSGGPDSLWKLGAVGLALVCWSLVLFGALARQRSGALLVWTLPWLVVPTVVVGLYSVSVQDIYNPRYFTFSTAALALLVGQGLALIGRRWLLAVAVALIVLCASPVYASQRTMYAKSSTDWSGVAHFVAAHRGEGGRQAVYFSPRYPIKGPLVSQTARGVKTAYPEAFAEMLDVTLLRTPVQDDNLSGTSRLLQDSLAQLSDVDTVWVVRRNDYRYLRTDDQTLVRAGFRPGRQWRGPVDQVVEFRKHP
jgi:mannosyltransferase